MYVHEGEAQRDKGRETNPSIANQRALQSDNKGVNFAWVGCGAAPGVKLSLALSNTHTHTLLTSILLVNSFLRSAV